MQSKGHAFCLGFSDFSQIPMLLEDVHKVCNANDLGQCFACNTLMSSKEEKNHPRHSILHVLADTELGYNPSRV